MRLRFAFLGTSWASICQRLQQEVVLHDRAACARPLLRSKQQKGPTCDRGLFFLGHILGFLMPAATTRGSLHDRAACVRPLLRTNSKRQPCATEFCFLGHPSVFLMPAATARGSLHDRVHPLLKTISKQPRATEVLRAWAHFGFPDASHNKG